MSARILGHQGSAGAVPRAVLGQRWGSARGNTACSLTSAARTSLSKLLQLLGVGLRDDDPRSAIAGAAIVTRSFEGRDLPQSHRPCDMEQWCIVIDTYLPASHGQ